MKSILIIPFILLYLGCGLYIPENKEDSYETMVEFGLNQMTDMIPVIVEVKEDLLSSYYVIEEIDYTAWVERDLVRYNNLDINTFISNRGNSVLLIPFY